MDRVEEIFNEYVASYLAGESDPRPFTGQLDGLDREELVILIDNYLTTAPGRKWDPEAFRGSQAEAMVEPLAKSLVGGSGTWPSLLPELRHQRRIRRKDLVAELALALDVPESEERVAEYYHGMEQGTVDSSGVSQRVLMALGKILRTKDVVLREAGQAIAGMDLKGQQPTFARLSPAPAKKGMDSDAMAGLTGQRSPGFDGSHKLEKKTDMIVDRLFTGGN